MKNILITIVLFLAAMAVQAQTSPAAKKEVADIRNNHYPKFGKHLPKELNAILDDLESRLNKA